MPKMSTNPFTDDEVESILETLKTKPQYHTASEKEKFMVYVEIARKLSAPPSNFRRSALQVRYKILTLQKGYTKLKARPTHLSSVHQHTVRYYELLDKIFGGRSPGKKKADKRKITNKTNDKIIKQQPNDPLLVYDSFIIKEELAEGETGEIDKFVVEMPTAVEDLEHNKHDKTKVRKDFDDYSLKLPQTMITVKNPNVVEEEAEGLSDEDESPGFQIMKECFHNEVIERQKELVDAIQVQDKMFMHNYKIHCKYHDAILKRDRQEINKILLNDRKEMLKIFKSVLNAMGKTLSYEFHDKNDETLTSSNEEENTAEK